MVETDAINYIKKQFQAGYTEEEIRGALINSGWPEKDVNDAFYVIHGESQPVKPQAAPQQQQETEEVQPPAQEQPAVQQPQYEEQEGPLPQPGKPLGTKDRGSRIMGRLRIGAIVSIIGGALLLVNYAMINYLGMEDLMIMFYQEVMLVTFLTSEMIQMIVLYYNTTQQYQSK